MAEWLGTGLQNLLQRFDSASHLQKEPPGYWRALFVFIRLVRLIVLCKDLEVGLGMVTYGAYIRGLLSYHDVTAVGALPDGVSVL